MYGAERYQSEMVLMRHVLWKFLAYSHSFIYVVVKYSIHRKLFHPTVASRIVVIDAQMSSRALLVDIF